MESGNNDSALAILAARASQGDEVAFGRLVEQTHQIIYRLALRLVDAEIDAEDIAQETCIRAWRGLPRLRDHEAVLGWMCRIVRNVAADRMRKARRLRTESLDRPVASGSGALVDYISTDEPGPERSVASAQACAEVRAMIDQLKEKHRLVLLLREVDGMSYEQLAQVLGCPVGTVESRLHRARKALAAKLKRLQQHTQAKETA